MVFVEAWGTEAKKHTHVQEKWGLLALPKNHYVPEIVWCFGLGAPGLPKNTWPKNNFGIPLNITVGLRNYRSVSRLAPAGPNIAFNLVSNADFLTVTQLLPFGYCETTLLGASVSAWYRGGPRDPPGTRPRGQITNKGFFGRRSRANKNICQRSDPGGGSRGGPGGPPRYHALTDALKRVVSQ